MMASICCVLAIWMVAEVTNPQNDSGQKDTNAQIGTVLGKPVLESDLNKNVELREDLVRLFVRPVEEKYLKEQLLDPEEQLKRRIPNEASRIGALIFVRQRVLHEHLYKKHGGRVLLTAFGPFAYDAHRKWLKERERAGDFKLDLPEHRAWLFEELDQKLRPRLTEDADTIRQAFDPAATEKLIEQTAAMPAESVNDSWQDGRTPLCSVPFPQLVRPTSWSDSRYTSFLLSRAELHSSVGVDASVSTRLTSIYYIAEQQWRIAIGNPDAKAGVAWDNIALKMEELLTEPQLQRATQLYRQQMGLGILLTNDTTVRSALGLTEEQRQEIGELIAAYELATAQLSHHFANVDLSERPVSRPDLLIGIKIAAAKESWLKYWLDRQTEAGIVAELTQEQKERLAELRGAPAKKIQPPFERFGPHVIRGFVEMMTPGPYRTKLIYLRPPNTDDVIRQWLAAQHLEKEEEPPRDTLHVVTEKIVDHVMDSLPSDKMHPGQWHVAIYSCTLFRSDVIEPVGLIFKDVTRFYPALEPVDHSKLDGQE